MTVNDNPTSNKTSNTQLQRPLVIAPQWLERLVEEPNKKRLLDQRSPFQRDKARVLHSAAFRRLQSKTQIHNNGLSDFYRTRLTHSLEVAQIGTGIVANLKLIQPEFLALLPGNNLIETICLSHDIGHPPFGHGGETALNYMMIKHGGFEGNGQTFRILTQLEQYTEFNGMNLTRRSLLGLLKYPICLSEISAAYPQDTSRNFRQLKTEEWMPAKGIYDHDKTLLDAVLAPLCESDRQLFGSKRTPEADSKQHLKSKYKSLDCSIMEIADDIAYGVHDLEDAIAMGIITKALWQEKVLTQLSSIEDFCLHHQLQEITDNLFSSQHFKRKDAIGALVNALITSIRIQQVNKRFVEPLLAYNAYLAPAMFQALEILKKFVLNYVIKSPDLQILEYRGQQIVMELFEAFRAGPLRFLPERAKQLWKEQNGDSSREQRVIADYISSLTDNHALRLHASLFSSNQTTPMIGEHTF
ncbi:deoxyguanosinetriphosphate triphosphohydrolase family protein [Psychromonas sp. RZ22]|uniref:anti-phage deoxyguanosine triphosphatase n=1 Tax=Psychromonas algarum TaxID=2555643 RepID=UPI0010672D78|nr:anti-phage deoxyguanosine triphosphatase [Psychromonas sp. RZ22]TEW54345.1 deoxyguanosinetriphosphate triphosphohydrolase family protein [Psychromonas sp. RZ22]